MSNEVRGSREVQLFFSYLQPIIFLTWTGVSVGVFNKTAARLKRSALYFTFSDFIYENLMRC